MDKHVAWRRGYHWPLPLLLFFIFLAFGLRLHNLDSFSFWTDEGLTPLRASYSLAEILGNEITIQEGVGKDTHPPLYYLIIHFSRQMLGETDFAYRYPSLLAGVLLIPLLFQFGRRLQGNGLGLMAAMLTAVNPLQIWYSNEARMYTILALLGALASYVLWRALTTGAWRRYLPPYLLLAGLTIYTHYTAVFLIGVQGLFWAWFLWHNGQRRLIVGTAVTLTILAIPLIPFTIPRLFTGAEANYFYVSPFIMLQDVIHAFSLGVTIDFKLLSTRLLDLGALGLLLAGIVAARTWLQRAFLLVYLYAVVLGLMVGSLIKPMYQGARHIMAGSPAFLLLLAWGLVWLITKAMKARRRGTAVTWGSLAILGSLVVLAGPFLSLDNLYRSPDYSKNDFRSLIEYIEQHAGGNDLILYNDAVLLPLHDHYRQRSDIAATALPTYPYPVNAQTTADLTTLSQTYTRIWFVTSPPADKRDTDGQVRGWLDNHLVEVADRNFAGHNVEVRVIAYATAPQAVAALPPDSLSLDIQWPDLPQLAGLQLQFDQPTALPTLWLDLFWQGSAVSGSDTQLRFTLRGLDDEEWVIQLHPLAETAVPWPDHGLVRQNYALPIPTGTPPGAYTLFLEPLATATGPSLGQAQPLTDIVLAAPESGSIQARQAVNTPSLQFQNGLTLLGIEFPDNEVRPGHNLRFTLYWQADTPLPSEDSRYEIEIIAPDGSLFKQQEGTPAASWLDTWPVNIPIAEHTGLYFRPEAEPGRYRLRWRLWEGDNAIGGRPSWRPWYSASNELGEVEVKPWPLVTELPNYIGPTQVDFGPDIQLSGYMYEHTAGTLGVTLYWQAKAMPDTNYYSFVHLVTAGGDIITQQAFVPVNGLRPTQGWRAGEIVTDAYTFALPPDLPAGTHTLVVGLFDPETEERPSVSYQGQPQANNQFVLGAITLP